MSNPEKSILITGASSGIGQAIAQRLARDGYEVIAHYGKNREGARETLRVIKEQGGKARMLSFDVSNTENAREILEADMEAHGPYYGVVCNAGITADAAFPALSAEDWRRVVDTNLNGFYNVLQPVVMPMVRRRQPGRIVTISSASGLMGNRGQVNYSASKAGIIGATKALAIELAKRQITVNCVAPGLIESEMTHNLPVEQLLEAIPARRMGKPEEVAGLVAFLCSDEAAYITRQVLSINGGLC
jgi:3-oxoacyl-[acyl-carrier protein] reductase